jgi:FkbM family methyltransferase
MIQCRGIWLPSHEEHLLPHIEGSPIIDGAGTYQYAKLEMALRHVKQFRVAVDIGAHVGLWSRVLASRFDRVEAFEPMPEHRDCFVLNVAADNVSLHDCALGASEAEARMTIFHGNSGHSHVADGGEVVVPMLTLDSFGLEDVDFCKIDVEGYERNVILGAIDTLKRCKPTLIVEQKPRNGSRYGHGDHGALRLLERLGAKTVAQKAGDYVMVW